MLAEVVERFRPQRLCDVGTGCGHAIRRLVPHCPWIAAIDPEPGLRSRWSREPSSAILCFLAMDGRSLGFRDAAFDLVVETDCLHHVEDWRAIVREMLRVSRGPVYLEEPVDDLRSQPKRDTARACELFLALQREVGYSHFPHLAVESLCGFLEEEAMLLDRRLLRHDEPVSFDDFFESYADFARRSPHERVWLERRERLREELRGRSLCEDDRLLLLARKRS
jgi:SAM-dependent methyltransferase